jgi:teichoic acid transport system permease protein
VYFILHAFLGLPFGPGLAFLPLMIFLLFLFNLGCALLYAPLTVFFRDTSALLPYITQIWTYMTPVLYTIAEIPPRLLVFLRWNPLYSFWAVFEQIYAGRMPSARYIFQSSAWAIVFLVVGGVIFLLREREFAFRF